jgi:hypothetical protein
MIDVTESGKNPFDLLLDSIRLVVREEITAAISGVKHNEPDHLITAEKAAAILGQPGRKGVRWLYRHSKRLPFTRSISRKHLRFSETGLRHWIESKRPPFRR